MVMIMPDKTPVKRIGAVAVLLIALAAVGAGIPDHVVFVKPIPSEISFTKQEGSILRAVAYGDGQGRPDSLRIYYSPAGAPLGAGGIALPDSVTFDWPAVGKNHIVAPKTAITPRSDFLLHVDLRAVKGSVPTGFTKFDGGSLGRGNVKVYGEVGTGDNQLDVYEAFGPVLADSRDAVGNPRVEENKNPGIEPDVIRLNLSEQPRLASGENIQLLYYKGETPPDPAVGGNKLTTVSYQLDDALTNAYTVGVEGATSGLAAGDWIRLDPDGALTDRAAQPKSAVDDYEHPDTRAHLNNRWVRLRGIEAKPEIISAYYTSNYTETGYIDFAYVKFDKPVAGFHDWFVGGSVKFDAAVPITGDNAGNIFRVDPTDTRGLIIDLNVAYKSHPKEVRTSGDIAFSLSFGKDMVDVSGVARDGAKPLLAETLILKVGSLSEDGNELPDTLTVVYSERLAASLTAAGTSQPVTFYLSGDVRCTPRLSISDPEKQVTERRNGFSQITYIVEDIGCPGKSFPITGDYARINIEPASVADVANPANLQDVAGNLKQPIKVERGPLNWVSKVKNNPLRLDHSGTNSLSMSLKPGAKGAEKVNIKATVAIYDKTGHLILIDSINVNVGTGVGVDEFVWGWKGHNKKGRLVSTGVYLFRAVFDAEILGEGGVVVDRQRYSLQRTLGVVWGKNSFSAGKTPASKLSGNVNFFWDGGGIKRGALLVYDALGNIVKKVPIWEPAAPVQGKRVIGSWDLTDINGNAVAEGSYAVTGTITPKNGSRESVSAIVVVGR